MRFLFCWEKSFCWTQYYVEPNAAIHVNSTPYSEDQIWSELTIIMGFDCFNFFSRMCLKCPPKNKIGIDRMHQNWSFAEIFNIPKQTVMSGSAVISPICTQLTSDRSQENSTFLIKTKQFPNFFFKRSSERWTWKTYKSSIVYVVPGSFHCVWPFWRHYNELS